MKSLAEQNQTELDRRYRATAAILAAQVLTVVVLTIAAFFISGRANTVLPENATTILWVVLLIVAIGAFFLRRMLFAPAVLRDTATLKGAVGLIRNLQIKTILVASLGEVVAFLGFLIALSSGDWLDMLRASAVALIVFFIAFPRKTAWLRVAQAAS